MTLVRIAALAFLLGTAVTGVVWFAWGVAEGFVRERSAPSADAKPKESKAPKRETGRAA